MAFYNPLFLKTGEISEIIYIDKGVEKILEREDKAVQNHIKMLLDKNSPPKDTDYLIIFLWAEKGEIMSDRWIFTKIDAWGSGPLADVKIFQGQRQVTDMGVGSGNTLLVLGKEEELRRNSKSLNNYLSGPGQTCRIIFC